MSRKAAQKSLEVLLRDLFNAEELRQFVAGLSGKEKFEDHLPGKTVSNAELCHQAVRVLDRRGAITTAFFAELKAVRTDQFARIKGVELRWERANQDQAEHDWSYSLPHCVDLPNPPECFVGREAELVRIHEMLVGGAQVPLNQQAAEPVGLTGLGGVGKTTLATKYAYNYLRNYEHVCWVNAQGDDPSEAFSKLANPLRLFLHVDAVISEKVSAIREWLERAARPTLLILDNVEHPRRWRDLVPRFGATRVLVTTRREDLFAEEQKVPVGVLSEEQALKLLLGSQNLIAAERSAGADLCKELGYLPIATALASRLITFCGMLPSALLTRIRSQGVVVWSAHPYGEELLAKNPSLVALYDTSVALLRTSQPVDEFARRLLWAAGWFASAEIPRATLLESGARLYDGVLSPEEADDALSRLVMLGLIVADETRRPSLHPLVGAYARARGGEAASRVVLDTLGAVAASTSSETVTLRGLLPLAPHLAEAAGRLDDSSPEAHLWIALRLAQLNRVLGRYSEMLTLANRGASLCKSTILMSSFLSEAGQALAQLGQYDMARERLECSLGLLDGRSDDVDRERAVILGHIGHILLRKGQYEEALMFHQQALLLIEGLAETDATFHAFALNAVGQALNKLGRYDEALETQLRVIASHKVLLGRNHEETAVAMVTAGQTLCNLGRSREATEYYKQALASFRHYASAAQNPEHISITLHGLSQALIRMGRHNEARKYLRQDLTSTKRRFGADHPEVAIILGTIGTSFLKQGEHTKALQPYREACLILEGTPHGAARPEFSIILNGIGQCLHAQGAYTEALEYYRRDLAVKKETLGTQHPFWYMSQFHYHRCCHDLGDTDSQRKMRENFERLESLMGPEHDNVKAIRVWLS